MILLDTNILIRLIKGDTRTAEWLEHIPRSELAISSITVYELAYGSLRANVPANRTQLLQSAVASVEQVSFDGAAAVEAARIRLSLEQQGMVIGPMDLLIAGIAVSRKAKLATFNRSEFSRVSGLDVICP